MTDTFAPLTEEEKSAALLPIDAVDYLDDEARRFEALMLLTQCDPIESTPAEIYLRSRSIDPNLIPPGIICWHQSSDAMVAIGHNARYEITCVQRLFFDRNGTPIFSEGKKRRRTKGVMKGSALMIPGDGYPLVCEGVEDALSLYIATGRSTFATFGLSNLGSVPVADGAHVTIVADNDERGRAGARKAAVLLSKRNCVVSIAIPDGSVKDANEILTTDGADAVRAMVEAAQPFTAEEAARVTDAFDSLTEEEESAASLPIDVVHYPDEDLRPIEAFVLMGGCCPIESTPAEIYLRSRSIDPNLIPPGAIGWHCSSGAMLAVGRNAKRGIACVQRLFFDHNDAPIIEEGKKRRRINGVMEGSAFMIPGDGNLLICEGVEDALSLHQATGRPAFAAFGLTNLGSVPVADGAQVTIVADNDERGRAGARKAAVLLSKRNCVVSIAVPDGVKDANELLTTQGADAVRAMVEAAPVFSAENAHDRKKDWPEPKPLPEGLLPVAKFNIALLPESIGPWVEDIADRIQCPPEFVATPAMVGLGAALGRKIGIRPQKHTDWLETANLWGCIIGRPGLMKSPAMAEALKPLNRLESQARELHEAELASFATQAEIYKLQRDEASKLARAALKEGKNASSCFDFDEPKPPVAKRFIVNDTSYEALGEVLADNPNGVLAFRDELVSLLKTLDREDNAAARGFFLTAWNGTSGYSFDRILRGRKHIKAACLSLLGSTQPGRMAEYIRRATNGGAMDDGLIQRFGLMVYPDQTSEWRDVDRGPNTAARQRAWEAFEAFEGIDSAAIGAEKDDFEDVPFLRFDDPAQGLFNEWRASLEAKLRSGELSPALESHLAKYRKLVPALALINHLADGGVGSVCEPALLRALAFTEFLETHARRVYAAGSEAETASAKAILSRIRRGDLQDGFTARDVHQRGWANLSDRDAVKASLDLLVDLDWLTATTEQTGGRPRTTYAINPRAR